MRNLVSTCYGQVLHEILGFQGQNKLLFLQEPTFELEKQPHIQLVSGW